MDPVSVAMSLISLVVDLVGQEKASEMVSAEAKKRANDAADAIAAARGLT